MNNIKGSLKLLRFNLINVILFEVVLKAIAFALLVPLYYFLVNKSIRWAGLQYLTKESMNKYVRMPSTYLVILILFIVVMFYLLVNVFGLSYVFGQANVTKKISFFRMLYHGLRSALRCFIPKNLPIFIFAAFYVPVTGTANIVLQAMNFRFPYYLTDFALNHKKFTSRVMVIYIVISLVMFLYCYTLHIFNREKMSFPAAMKKAGKVLKARRHLPVVSVTLWTIGLLVFTSLFLQFYRTTFMGWVISIGKYVKVLEFIANSIGFVLATSIAILLLPMIYSFICHSYYKSFPDLGGADNISYYHPPVRMKKGRKRTIATIILIVALLAIDLSFYSLQKRGVLKLFTSSKHTVTITAHRGASNDAPENTMPAFHEAVDQGADVLELDVRETADGVVVVMHDSSLERTIGVKKKVGEITYEELLTYNAAAKFIEKHPKKAELYQDVKVPTLQEVIDEFKGTIKFNIELKPAKTDENLAFKVAEIVHNNDIESDTVVTSLNYKQIKKIKKYDSDIKTVYVMALAVGDFSDLEYADNFSIKSGYINNYIVQKAHKAGKHVYAWTVDNPEVLDDLMLLNVDSIITNEPEKMRKAMYKNYYGNSFFNKLETFLGNVF